MNKKRGMSVALIIAVVAGVFVLGSVAVFNMQPEEEKMMAEGEEMMHEGEEMMSEGEDMMKEGEEQMREAESMMNDEEKMMEENTSMMEEGATMMGDEEFSGDRIAGSPKTPLLEYNDEDYEKALASGKLVVLYFYANWCPTCKIEFPKMEKAFDGFTDENVVGFRVNFKDNQTSDSEKEVAREHGVPSQHTKVFIKDGERILKTPESWDTAKYVSEITSNL
jgi:thiol-disulfide isomerase/thioredoxin